MALRYYDDAIVHKLLRWIPENSNLRVLKPDESRRLFELMADDKNDKPLQMPFIALSRNNDIQLLSNIKQLKSFNGAWITNKGVLMARAKNAITEKTTKEEIDKYVDNWDVTATLNAIPVKLEYQLDIYTKHYDEGDEYLRTFLFKLINNPVIKIVIPYNGFNYEHIANIRVLDSVSDTSGISERLFSGQFTRWTIQMEIQDAFLFSIPYRQNWIVDADVEVVEKL